MKAFRATTCSFRYSSNSPGCQSFGSTDWVSTPTSKAGPCTQNNLEKRWASTRIPFRTTADFPPNFSAPCGWLWTQESTRKAGHAIKSWISSASRAPSMSRRYNPKPTATLRGLRRPRNVAVGFGLYRRLIDGARLAEEIHDLIACPAFRVDSCVHNQPHGAEKFGGKSAVVRNGILVEAHLFSKLFCVQGPAFDVGVETQSVEPKLGQAGELLLHRKLHVVARNAFMVRNRFVVDQRALGELGGCHHHATRTLAVRSARDIVRGGRGLERRNRLDRHRRFREEREQVRKLGFHLRNVVPKVVQNLIRGRGYVFGVGLQGRTKRSQVRETLLLGNYQHLRLDTFDFTQAQLVDFVGVHVRGGAAINIVLVALLPVRQRSHGKDGAAMRSIFCAQKGSESLVGRNDIDINSSSDLLRETLLFFRRNFRWIFLCRLQEGIGVDDALALNRQLLNQESHRHQVVFHPGPQNFRGLAEGARDLVKTGDIVFIVFHRIEGDRERQIREGSVDAILLVDRHLEFFQVKVGNALLQHANQQVVGELILVGETRRGNRLEAAEESPICLIALGNGCK